MSVREDTIKAISLFLFLLGSLTAFAGNPLPAWIHPDDAQSIKPLLPTTYYIAYEEKTSCVGPYRRRNYDGTERTLVKRPDGSVIAEVCTRFYKVLSMEGTGVLKDRGQGRVTVNWAGKGRFIEMEKCRYGLGVQGLCLLPFHNIAADLKAHPVGTVLFIPRVQGLKLPNGMIHDGIFVVRDTGGAFRGIGPQRVDLFIANQDDGENVFKAIGMHHRKPEVAFRLIGKSKDEAIARLKEKFPVLYLAIEDIPTI